MTQRTREELEIEIWNLGRRIEDLKGAIEQRSRNSDSQSVQLAASYKKDLSESEAKLRLRIDELNRLG